MINTQPLAWHYTTGQKFKLIKEDGFLDPNKTFTPPHEKPILWFSKNEHFEPTAQKAILMPDGSILPLGMMGSYKHLEGLFRFGYPVEKLIRYKQVCKEANMRMRDMVLLELAGLKQGAKPHNWLGTLNQISLSECTIEYFDGENWHPI